MQSLDGVKELTFLENHTVNLSEKQEQTQPARDSNAVAGAWAFDENAKRYFVTLAQRQQFYTLVQPKNSEVCILMSGELAAANMGESWFGRTVQDLYEDLEPPDRF